MIPVMSSAARRTVDDSSERSLALSLDPIKRNARASERGWKMASGMRRSAEIRSAIEQRARNESSVGEVLSSHASISVKLSSLSERWSGLGACEAKVCAISCQAEKPDHVVLNALAESKAVAQRLASVEATSFETKGSSFSCD